MLRPATPLSILLFISFVLLLVSTISTPIVKGIPLARYQNVQFGVFGWCKDSGECSGIQVGWNTDNALPASDDAEFQLPSSTRHSLSSLLVVHPVAALCNLIVLGLAIAAHFHSPSHSARYLLALLILLLPTLLVTLLAFLVDILLFVPHLQWGGWIVLASTILITASGVVTCAMRRTLVSRKARKKRIAENAEMSGANFYARQAEDSRMAANMTPDSKSPMVNGAPGSDNLPGFATYNRRSEERSVHQPVPLEPISTTSPAEAGGRFYSGTRSRSSSRPRQDFATPAGPPEPYENQPPMPQGPMRGAYGPPRGRGGYPPRGAMSSRGSSNSRGPPPSPYGRGGYPMRGRGGYPPGPPPPGVMGGAMGAPGMGRRPPPGYGPQDPDAMPGRYGPPDGARTPGGTPYRPEGLNYEPTSPSVYSTGDNVPFGAYGARAQSPARSRHSPYGSRAQSPAGGRIPQAMPPPPIPAMPDQSQYMPNQRQPNMVYDAVVQPPDDSRRMTPRVPDPNSVPPTSYVSPRAGWSDLPQAVPQAAVRRRRVGSGGSDYVEDVDPKFAEPAAPSAPPAEDFNQPAIPHLLVPGRHPNDVSPVSSDGQLDTRVPPETSSEDLHHGARSPVESETSNFTSVSQRPMNPNWQPGHGGEFNSFGPNQRQHQQRRQDLLFSNNPDFEIPGMGPPRGNGMRGRGRGGYMGSRQPGPMRPPPPSVLDDMGNDGRYPAPMSQTGHGSTGGIMREI